jgi:endonuclease YncB( thermonuclease family)
LERLGVANDRPIKGPRIRTNRIIWRYALGLFVLLLGALPAAAETIHGRVVAVTDGDTITVLDETNRQRNIRLAGIDAPERRQAFHEASRQNLVRLAHGKRVVVDWYKLSYKRLVGNVYLDGADLGLAQVNAGMAWHYKRFEGEQTYKARTRYTTAELRARSRQIGLWRDEQPIPPWEWRSRRL